MYHAAKRDNVAAILGGQRGPPGDSPVRAQHQQDYAAQLRAQIADKERQRQQERQHSLRQSVALLELRQAAPSAVLPGGAGNGSTDDSRAAQLPPPSQPLQQRVHVQQQGTWPGSDTCWPPQPHRQLLTTGTQQSHSQEPCIWPPTAGAGFVEHQLPLPPRPLPTEWAGPDALGHGPWGSGSPVWQDMPPLPQRHHVPGPPGPPAGYPAGQLAGPAGLRPPPSGTVAPAGQHFGGSSNSSNQRLCRQGSVVQPPYGTVWDQQGGAALGGGPAGPASWPVAARAPFGTDLQLYQQAPAAAGQTMLAGAPLPPWDVQDGPAAGSSSRLARSPSGRGSLLGTGSGSGSLLAFGARPGSEAGRSAAELQRRAAYRTELERQMQQKEERRRQDLAEERAAEARRARQAQELLQKQAAGTYGGGSGPLRDADGRPVTDLNQVRRYQLHPNKAEGPPAGSNSSHHADSHPRQQQHWAPGEAPLAHSQGSGAIPAHWGEGPATAEAAYGMHSNEGDSWRDGNGASSAAPGLPWQQHDGEGCGWQERPQHEPTGPRGHGVAAGQHSLPQQPSGHAASGQQQPQLPPLQPPSPCHPPGRNPCSSGGSGSSGPPAAPAGALRVPMAGGGSEEMRVRLRSDRPYVSASEAERRARAQAEFKEALRQQMEEKARLRQEEQQRRKAEEAEEEARLAREQERLRQQFNQDQADRLAKHAAKEQQQGGTETLESGGVSVKYKPPPGAAGRKQQQRHGSEAQDEHGQVHLAAAARRAAGAGAEAARDGAGGLSRDEAVPGIEIRVKPRRQAPVVDPAATTEESAGPGQVPSSASASLARQQTGGDSDGLDSQHERGMPLIMASAQGHPGQSGLATHDGRMEGSRSRQLSHGMDPWQQQQPQQFPQQQQALPSGMALPSLLLPQQHQQAQQGLLPPLQLHGAASGAFQGAPIGVLPPQLQPVYPTSGGGPPPQYHLLPAPHYQAGVPMQPHAQPWAPGPGPYMQMAPPPNPIWMQPPLTVLHSGALPAGPPWAQHPPPGMQQQQIWDLRGGAPEAPMGFSNGPQLPVFETSSQLRDSNSRPATGRDAALPQIGSLPAAVGASFLFRRDGPAEASMVGQSTLVFPSQRQQQQPQRPSQVAPAGRQTRSHSHCSSVALQGSPPSAAAEAAMPPASARGLSQWDALKDPARPFSRQNSMTLPCLLPHQEQQGRTAGSAAGAASARRRSSWAGAWADVRASADVPAPSGWPN